MNFVPITSDLNVSRPAGTLTNWGVGWFAARTSGTENVYKIYAESFQSAAHLDALVVEARRIVAGALAAPLAG